MIVSTKLPSNTKLYQNVFLVVPVLITVVWAVSLSMKCEKMCWDDYSNHSIMYLISVPMMTALTINLLFLINIIRIVITKLRDEPSLSTQQLQVINLWYCQWWEWSQSKGVVCAIVPISGSDVRHFLKWGHSVNRLDSRDIPGHK